MQTDIHALSVSKGGILRMMDLQFPDDENGAVLRRLASEGVNLKKMRNVEFAVAVPDRKSADLLAAELRRLGYRSEVSKPGHEDENGSVESWDVISSHRIKPNHFNITAIEEALGAIALPFGGRNDGWGFFES